ncbi:LADA_0F07206g1_1 [Lachancea dasiensis]|uniref:LADA_0F07206g1_1 n=1 Tax=Lachancea dasiensis TaxID=1072105 RepID=A0A1G4JKF0_9SACH|nr:LADA_0F07206g1_1 [Lachancea dasiensis]
MVVVSLGLGHDNDMLVPQTTFKSSIKIVKIEGGGNFTVLLLENGWLYLAGDLPLELECNGDKKTWRRVPGLYRDVACGWSHIVAITVENFVVTGGVGERGELGQGSKKESPFLNPIMQIRHPLKSQVLACFYNTYVLDGGQLLGCGSNTKCQIREPKERIIDSLVNVCEASVSQACAGKNYVFYQKADGHIRLKGSISNSETHLPPMDQFSAFECRSMWTSLLTFNANQKFQFYGQANQKQDAIIGFSCNGPVTAWSTGSEHGIVCIGGKQVFCWGWGEHGNCGSLPTSPTPDGVNDRSNINSGVNLAYKVDSTDVAIYTCFGGCATSWICVERLGS